MLGCQEIGKCARTNGMDQNPIPKNYQIITKKTSITHPSRN